MPEKSFKSMKIVYMKIGYFYVSSIVAIDICQGQFC